MHLKIVTPFNFFFFFFISQKLSQTNLGSLTFLNGGTGGGVRCGEFSTRSPLVSTLVLFHAIFGSGTFCCSKHKFHFVVCTTKCEGLVA